MLLSKYTNKIVGFFSLLFLVLLSAAFLAAPQLPQRIVETKIINSVNAQDCNLIFRGSLETVYVGYFFEIFTPTPLPGNLTEYVIRNTTTSNSVRLGTTQRSQYAQYTGQYSNFVHTFNNFENPTEYQNMVTAGNNTYQIIRNDTVICTGSITIVDDSTASRPPVSYPDPDCVRAAQACDLDIFDIDTCRTVTRLSCEATANGNSRSNFETCSTPFSPPQFRDPLADTDGPVIGPGPLAGVEPDELTTCLSIRQDVLDERDSVPIGEARCPTCPIGFSVRPDPDNPGRTACAEYAEGGVARTIQPDYVACNTNESCYLRGRGGCVDNNQACIPNEGHDGINPCEGDPLGRSFTCETSSGRQCCNTRHACDEAGGTVESCYVVGALPTTGGAPNMCRDPFPVHCIRNRSATEAEDLCCRTNADCETSSGNSIGRAESDPYRLCEQVSVNDRQACELCINRNSIWTSIGCISTEGGQTVRHLIVLALGMAGGIGLLMIIASGAMFTLSKNDPKKVGDAKELLSSVVIGLVFIAFSVTILQFIGVTVLRIPGFGGP
jgi:hypothetical protein